jgi:hypothetical protein
VSKAAIARDHCLAPERVDAPVVGRRLPPRPAHVGGRIVGEVLVGKPE